MGDTSETNTKVLSQELFFRCGSTKKTAYTENHYMRDMDPFPRYCHICVPHSYKKGQIHENVIKLLHIKDQAKVTPQTSSTNLS